MPQWARRSLIKLENSVGAAGRRWAHGGHLWRDEVAAPRAEELAAGGEGGAEEAASNPENGHGE